jgi:hypothetical protein
MSELAKKILSKSHELVDQMLKEERSAARVLLKEQENKRKQSAIPRPAWLEKYEQPEQPPGEGG